jgi:hypothetical protein
VHVICFHESYRAKALEIVLTDLRKLTGRQLADYCLTHLAAVFTHIFKEGAGDDLKHRFWQSTRQPVQIETETFWQAKFDYLHANPCRKRLVTLPEHWRVSSASYWLHGGKGDNDVLLTGLDW